MKGTLFILLCGLGIALQPLAEAGQDFRQRLSQAEVSAEGLSADIKAEIAFGREVAARILGRYPLLEREELNHYVNLVGQNLVRHASRPELEYHFAVVNTPDINAYTAPGGYIFVTRGSLALMENEAELAAVLAHEIAHVTQKHIVKELNIHATESSPEAGLARLFGGASDPARIAFRQALDQAVALLFTEGLKKEDEFESDMLGMLLATSAGYEPTALYHYLKKVQARKGAQTTVVDSTHPSFSQRLLALTDVMAEEALTSRPGVSLQGRFEQQMKKQ
jgi:predicted Zn-dependent protease